MCSVICPLSRCTITLGLVHVVRCIHGLLLLPWSIGSRGFFISQDRFWFLVPTPRAPSGL